MRTQFADPFLWSALFCNHEREPAGRASDELDKCLSGKSTAQIVLLCMKWCFALSMHILVGKSVEMWPIRFMQI